MRRRLVRLEDAVERLRCSGVESAGSLKSIRLECRKLYALHWVSVRDGILAGKMISLN